MHSLDETHDCIILGEGVGAISAALAVHARGQRCLLVLPRGNLAWECGLAFSSAAGTPTDPLWAELLREAEDCGGLHEGLLDGPVAQALLAERLRAAGLPVIEAALPLATDLDPAGLIRGLLVVTKQRTRLLRARRWIDATESGALLRLSGLAVPVKPVHVWTACASFYRAGGLASEPDLRSTRRADEGILHFAPSRPEAPWADLPALLEARPELAGSAVLGRCSWRAVAAYAAGDALQALPPNCSVAAPAVVATAVTSLAERSALGAAAAEALSRVPAADAGAAQLPVPRPSDEILSEVVVAGLGTGGSLAALSAAEHGARVVACEPQAFPGGIGTGGGISGYFYGLPAGRQRAIDDEVHALMQRHSGAFASHRHHFHPLAKTIVLDRLLREAGVDCRYGHMLCALEVSAGRIQRALLSDGDALHALGASTWVDATGDGDLCVQAGARQSHGREHDQLYHAYTQTAAQLHGRDAEARELGHINRDAGWCDPADPADLARARIAGIAQFLPDYRDPQRRPLQCFPTLGIRQAGQVVTDTVVSLDDLLSARRFPDEIGFACANVDNHATDLHWESDEAVFWNWAARNWTVRAICAIPYGALLPQGLDNCWIASRCLGVTQDAHYAIRMQRDIQRVGEVVGAAVALASRQGCSSRQLSLAEVFASLGEGAPTPPQDLGRFSNLDQIYSLDLPPLEQRIAAGLAAIDSAAGGPALWALYRHRAESEAALRQRLEAEDPHVSWFAACVLACWAEPSASPRLLRAIADREWGYDARTAEQLEARVHGRPDPNGCRRLAPNWLTALVLLRCCGDGSALPVLLELAQAADHILQVRCAIALSATAICARDPAARALAGPLAERLAADPIPACIHDPQLGIGALAQRVLDGDPPPVADGCARSEDHRWQLELAIARLRQIAGLPVALDRLMADPRASVRRATAALSRDPEVLTPA